MVWENSNQNGGFSEAKPWLPGSSSHLKDNVAAQTDKSDAMLHHYKAAIALRHAFPALAIGSHHDLGNTGEVLHFTRKQHFRVEVGRHGWQREAGGGHWAEIHCVARPRGKDRTAVKKRHALWATRMSGTVVESE